MTFSHAVDVLSGGHVRKYTFRQEAAPLDFANALTLMEESEPFRAYLISVLQAAPYDTYRWECPALTRQHTGRPFEFVLIDHPGLAATTDTQSFKAYFDAGGPDAGVVVFKNLGGDATLIVPSPLAETDAFNHLARFVRTATPAQIHALWRCVGRAMRCRLSERPVWLSTAGDGVSWLHIRLDDRPKYYRHQPYRQT